MRSGDPMLSLPIFAVLMGCSAKNTPPTSPIESSGKIEIEVVACDDPSLSLPVEVSATMMEVGVTKCVMPFDILIGADSAFDDAFVHKVAQVLAELLDQDEDGVADDPEVEAKLQQWDVAWLAMPADHNQWESSQLPALSGVLGYDIVVPTWWLGDSTGEPDEHALAVMVEEVTHFVTQFGWSPTYPEQFGVSGWNSVIAQETQSAQCDWWQHPENDCPDSPAEYPGDCSDPDCDVVEFYQQVLIMRAGMQPGWLGIGFPTTTEELEARLSDTIKQMMDDPQYHQISSPLDFDY